MPEYRIHVVTGPKSKAAGTEASILVVGNKGSFQSKLRKANALHVKGLVFQAGVENVFKVEPEPKSDVGEIQLVEFSIDFPFSPFANLYLESIGVEDVSAEKAYVFPCDKWFSETEGDGRISRVFTQRKVVGKPLLKAKASKVTLQQLASKLPATSRQSDSGFETLKKLNLKGLTKGKASSHIKELAFGRPFSNWAENVEVSNVYAFYPLRLWHVKVIIKIAHFARMKVRTVGATHTWTSLYPDQDQVLINPQLLLPEPGSQEAEYDATTHRVTVLCNVTTSALKHHQLENGYNFMFNTVLGGVTYGGIIGTGCHGVGQNCPAHPDLVKEIQVVNSDGELITYSETDEPMLRAVTTSMGLFGFIYKITFEVDGTLNIVQTHNSFEHTVGDTLISGAALKAIAEANFSTEVFWFPFNSNPFNVGSASKTKPQSEMLEFAKTLLGPTYEASNVRKNVSIGQPWDPLDDELLIKKVNFSDETPVEDDYYVFKNVKELLQSVIFRNIPDVIANYPQFTPVFTWFTNFALKPCEVLGLQLGEPERIVEHLPNAIHYRLWVHQGFHVYDLEMGFIVEDDYENIATACKDVVDIVTTYADNGQFPMSIALEMRFMSESKSLLCPAVVGATAPGDKIKVAYIEVLALGSAISRPLWEEFSTQVAEKWMTAPTSVKPLPHWGKASELGCSTDLVNYLWANNGDNMESFLTQLDQSQADPDKIFFNDYLEKIFTLPESRK
eukprot:m.307717 g.307717  ORF g.307717 m.307717 type:complete len:730 (+) comp42705_c0_seq1:193-2382(+)